MAPAHIDRREFDMPDFLSPRQSAKLARCGPSNAAGGRWDPGLIHVGICAPAFGTCDANAEPFLDMGHCSELKVPDRLRMLIGIVGRNRASLIVEGER